MKNVSMIINPNAITNIAPPPQPSTFSQHINELVKPQTIGVTFSAQFESDEEALTFASQMLFHIKSFKLNSIES